MQGSKGAELLGKFGVQITKVTMVVLGDFQTSDVQGDHGTRDLTGSTTSKVCEHESSHPKCFLASKVTLFFFHKSLPPPGICSMDGR